MKVYKVIHETLGEYIGHGLYNENVEVLAIHLSKDKAEKEAQKLRIENGGEYYVVEVEAVM